MENFIKKLKILLNKEDLNASKFSEIIGVQRSSVSHILSGRNKPSLDFILKIHKSTIDVDLEWLLSSEADQDLNSTTLPKPKQNTKNDLKIDFVKNDNIDRIVIFFSKILNKSKKIGYKIKVKPEFIKYCM